MAERQALLLDGESAERAVIACFLESAGFKTTAFDSIEGAREWVARQSAPPRLAVVSLQLPGAGGVDFASWFLGLNPALRMLFTSGRGAEDIRGADLPAGSFEVLNKPFLADDLQGAVASLMLRPTRQDRDRANPR